MKSRMLVLMSAITLAALTTPVWTAAQEAPRQAEDSSKVGTGATNPVPVLYQPLVPDTEIPGAAGVTLTVNGTGFVAGATVNWNGSPLATTFVSGSRLTASVPASDVAKAGTASVTVANPGPGGGSSNPAFFPVSLPVYLAFSASAFSAGSGPGSVATGDFNGDGKLDLIVPDPLSGDLSVLLGNGDGTFPAPVSYSVGQGNDAWFGQQFQVAVADLNGDGKLDFVVSDYDDNYVSVFLGHGDGTFAPGVTYAVGTNPSSVAVADVNGDGKPDLVVSNQNCPSGTCGKATVSILLGKGDGTFQPQSVYAAGQDANWVAVGDFNRDGKLDLAVVNGNPSGPSGPWGSALLILLGNGDGTFQTPFSHPLNSNGVSVAAADFNRDGKLDLAVADNVGVVSILLGNGNGTFQARVDYTVGCGLACSYPWGSISIGDFTQDGHLDLAVSNSGENSISILLGNGNGTFQSGFEPAIGSTDSSLPLGVAAGDFNQQGHLDLAVANISSNTVTILSPDGTISLSPTSLNFGAQLVGSSATREVTITNRSASTMTITGIAITGTDTADFTQTNTCGSSLGAGKSCTISVTFTPSQFGPFTALITVGDSDPSSPQTVPLSGTGVTSGWNVTLSPESLTFATQPVGITSPEQVITLGNYGTQTLSITGISLNSASFKQTHTCGNSLAAGASCAIDVTLTPDRIGAFDRTLSITDNAPGSPQIVSLSGTGTLLEVAPTSLGLYLFCPPNRPQCFGGSGDVTVTNVGEMPLSITGIVTGGNFSQTNNCGSLGAGQSCTIAVRCAGPRKVGATYRGELSVSYDGGTSVVSLTCQVVF